MSDIRELIEQWRKSAAFTEKTTLINCDAGDCADQLEAAMPAWKPIETAPKGYPALEESSEWFIALSAKKYDGPTSSNASVIRRVFNIGFGPWEGSGGEYYKKDYFTHWMPLLEPPEQSK